MANFTQSKIDEVWQKAKKVEHYNENEYRQDIAGAWIQKDKYGMEEEFGWEIDHYFPVSLGGTDQIKNLQPLQWENNRKKADDFPLFKTIVSSEGKENIKKEKEHTCDVDYFKQLYPDNKYLKDKDK
jgi:hypothetical protein